MDIGTRTYDIPIGKNFIESNAESVLVQLFRGNRDVDTIVALYDSIHTLIYKDWDAY